MLTKQHLTKFAVLFIFFTVFFIGVGLLFQKTGVDSRKGHLTKSFEDPNYIAETFYGKNNFLASKDGKVDAANPIGTILAGIRLYRDYQQWTSDPSNPTFVGLTGESLINTLGIGPLSGCESFGQITADVKDGPDTPNCFDSAPLNIDYSELSSLQQTNSQASLLGFLNQANYHAFSEADTMTNNTLYANDMIKQIPLVGQKASAFFDPDPFGANTTPTISWMKFYSLGDGFYALWVASRNLTYYLIIIPTIAFGLAIMFRVQIGPQTQVTLMQAIPQLLVVILLITFSYPLISLMINLAEPVRDTLVALIFQFQDATLTSRGAWNSVISVGVYGIFLIIAGGLSILPAVGVFVTIAVLFMLIFFAIVWMRYIFNIFLIIVKLGFFIGFGPLILVWAALPGKMDIVKNYFTNVASLVFGIVAMSVAYSAFFAIINFGLIIGPLAGLIFFFVACGVLWKAPTMQKQLAQAMGATSIFGGGDDKKRR